MDKNKRIQSNLLLLLTALIWGSAFVFQGDAADHLGAFSFNAVRSLVAGVALLPVIYFMSRARKARGESAPEHKQGGRKLLIAGGVLCGVVLTIASAFQQLGMQFGVNSGKAGFLTALYIIIVPVLGIPLKKRAHFTLWISVLLALVGLYFLCIKDEFRIETRDLLVIACGFCYALHILVIDHFSPRVNSVKMSCIQFFVCGVLSALVAVFTKERTTGAQMLAAWLPILYVGLLSSGVGYTLQMVAQKNTSPAMASMLMSLEAVFAALAGWLLRGQALTVRELIGCAVMFAAILLAQAPDLLPVRQPRASA